MAFRKHEIFINLFLRLFLDSIKKLRFNDMILTFLKRGMTFLLVLGSLAQLLAGDRFLYLPHMALKDLPEIQ